MGISKEYRFVLHIYPFKKSDFESSNANYLIHDALVSGKELGFNHHDLALDPEKLKKYLYKIRPLATEAEEIIVKSLISVYAIHAKKACMNRYVRRLK